MDEVQRTIEKAKDAMTARRVYGDAYEKNGVTIIPAARVQGAGGAGGGEGPGGQGQGSGGGFAVNARPVGVFVVKGEDVSWRPAIDVNRVILGGQIIALAAVIVVGWALRGRDGSEGSRSVAAARGRAQPSRGGMFWFRRNRFSGS